MNYLHYEFDIESHDVVEVTLDRQANVRLLDDANFALYSAGKKPSYHGGLAKTSPLALEPPLPGHWHVVVDLGGYSGRFGASAAVLKTAS